MKRAADYDSSHPGLSFFCPASTPLNQCCLCSKQTSMNNEWVELNNALSAYPGIIETNGKAIAAYLEPWARFGKFEAKDWKKIFVNFTCAISILRCYINRNDGKDYDYPENEDDYAFVTPFLT